MSNQASIRNAFVSAATVMLLQSACDRTPVPTSSDASHSSDVSALAATQDSQACADDSFTPPEGAELIAVLRPSVEAETDKNEAFEARGSLIHATENPEHMGVAVQDGDKQYVFIFEMDMSADPSQDEVLGLVGTSPTTQVLVRGVAQPAPTGVNNFDSSHCRWVYQLPGAQE